MTNQNDAGRDTERAGEWLVSVECRACGAPVRYAGTGRRPRYCSPACRQRAWALRNAERALSTDADPRPHVVRETIERRVPAAPPSAPAAPARAAPAGAAQPPSTAREWQRLLAVLAKQLGDEHHQLAREHWHHRRLYNALVTAVAQLGQAHPGGLDHLATR